MKKPCDAITQVEVPSVAPYSPLYNPGGPGNRPTPGVRYSAPSPPHTVDVQPSHGDLYRPRRVPAYPLT